MNPSLTKLMISGLLAGAAFSIGVESGTAQAADDQTITAVYHDFSDLSHFTLNRDAFVHTPNQQGAWAYGQHVLRLTEDVRNQAGSAFLTERVSLADERSFSAHFSFRIDAASSPGYGWPGADGIAFSIQTAANNVGSIGGGLGYMGVKPSVTIEYDTHHNLGWDPSGNHVGLNVNGEILSLKTADLPASLEYGGTWYSWDGPGKQLEVRVSQSLQRPAQPILTHSVDLTQVLDSDDVFVGFSSATGDEWAKHDILSFYFNRDFQPIEPDKITYTPVGEYDTDLTAPTTELILPAAGNGGWINEEFWLSWNCSKDVSGISKTEYRLNGSGDWLTEPILMTDGVYEIEYRSTDGAGNVEATKTATVKVDTTPGEVTAILPQPDGDNGWYTTDPQIGFSATDNLSGVNRIEYTIGDNGAWTTYTGPFPAPCGCKIRYRVIDEAGNESDPQELELNIDKTAPTLNLRIDPADLWPPNHKYVPIRVTVEASDDESGLASVVLTSITSNEPDDGLGDGRHTADVIEAEYGTFDTDFQVRKERSGHGTGRTYTVTYTATDYAGNVTTATATITIPHDQSDKTKTK